MQLSIPLRFTGHKLEETIRRDPKVQKPSIGILLDDRTFAGIMKGKTRHEAIPLYEKAAQRLNLAVCYFRLRDISTKSLNVRALTLDPSTSRYTSVQIRLPSIIHNRSMHFGRKAKRKLAKLQASGIYLYNRHTRYGKLFIHKLLLKNEALRPHLPETHRASISTIRRMMKRHDALLLKPNNGSIGRGIMMLQKRQGRWQLKVRSRVRKGQWRNIPIRSALPPVLRKLLKKRRYLVQQRLPLATYMGRPFDLRVSVQRNGSGQWQVTGIVGKAAPAGLFLTNVAQGGTVYTLDHLLATHREWNPYAVRMQIEELALRTAVHLAHYLPNLADIGLDIGLTADGFPMFIECNCRDLRYSFLQGGLLNEWHDVYYQPLSYGHYVGLQRMPDDRQTAQKGS